MCTNYRPSTRDLIMKQFGVEVPDFIFRDDIYPGYRAPIIRLPEQGTGNVECVAANFGLIPPWSEDDKIGRHTYNARTETVGEKPSFRSAWRKRQFCLVPMLSFCEPNYETGKAVRWRIGRTDQQDFAVAGIWERWTRGSEPMLSFSMLTLNADDHPLMGRFHRPGEEKRSLVIVPADQYRAWLEADGELARTFFSLHPLSEFTAAADPVPKPAAKVA